MSQNGKNIQIMKETIKIINHIRQSQAFWNPCFEKSFRSPMDLPAITLKKLATNWHAITRHFARTLPNLIVAITKQHELADEAELQRLETLGREVLKILGNDWGLGIKKFDDTNDHKLIHFKMFEHIPKKLGFVDYLEPETIQLMEDLSSGFTGSVEEGFGKLLVVEYTASNILRIGDAFERCVDENGKKFFTKSDIVYFPTHDVLEKTHASDTESLITLVGNTEARQEVLFDSVEKSTRAFGNYWNKLA